MKSKEIRCDSIGNSLVNSFDDSLGDSLGNLLGDPLVNHNFQLKLDAFSPSESYQKVLFV